MNIRSRSVLFTFIAFGLVATSFGDTSELKLKRIVTKDSGTKAYASEFTDDSRCSQHIIDESGITWEGSVAKCTTGSANDTAWHAEKVKNHPVVWVRFAAPTNLAAIKIFNLNWNIDRGVKTIKIYVSTSPADLKNSKGAALTYTTAGKASNADGDRKPNLADTTVWSPVGDTYTVAKASGSADYTGEDIVFSEVLKDVCWFAIEVLDANGSGSYVGISEIFFYELGEEGGGDEPGGDEPGVEPGGDEPGGDEPGGDEPGGDEPGGDEPVSPVVDPDAKRGVLVYEGFSANDFKLGTDAEDRTLDGARQHPSAPVDDIGLNDHGWGTHSSGRSRIYTEAMGLSLPAELIVAGHQNLGSSIGWDRSTSNAAGRSASQKLSAGVLAPSKAVDGKFYFRVLLSVDADAAAVMAKNDTLVTAKGESSQNLNYYGAGFIKTPDDRNHYNALVDAKSGIGFFIMKNKAGELKCVVGLANGSLEGNNPIVTQTVMGDVVAGRTYICYAEVVLNMNGAEIVSAGYQDVENYTSSNKKRWQVKNLQCDFITNDDYPEQIAITGCYGSKGYARADEFCAGTALENILTLPKSGLVIVVK